MSITVNEIEKSITDEVITGSPKYNVTDNLDGTKNIELANSVTQEGTSINKGYLGNLTHIGELRMFPTNATITDPKYLLCDGSSIDASDYPDIVDFCDIVNAGAFFEQKTFTVSSGSRTAMKTIFVENYIIFGVYNSDTHQVEIYRYDGTTISYVHAVSVGNNSNPSTCFDIVYNEENQTMYLIHNQNSNIAYLLKSTDFGTSWTSIRTFSINSATYYACYLDCKSNIVAVYVGSHYSGGTYYPNIFISTDYGENFTGGLVNNYSSYSRFGDYINIDNSGYVWIVSSEILLKYNVNTFVSSVSNSSSVDGRRWVQGDYLYYSVYNSYIYKINTLNNNKTIVYNNTEVQRYYIFLDENYMYLKNLNTNNIDKIYDFENNVVIQDNIATVGYGYLSSAFSVVNGSKKIAVGINNSTTSTEIGIYLSQDSVLLPDIQPINYNGTTKNMNVYIKALNN